MSEAVHHVNAFVQHFLLNKLQCCLLLTTQIAWLLTGIGEDELWGNSSLVKSVFLTVLISFSILVFGV